MKYHYQYVSKTTVRIELIPEDRKEIALIKALSTGDENNEQLIELFSTGLASYAVGTTLVKAKFMNFPTVALCNYIKSVQAIDNVA
ncbi:hypothetical protein EZ428_12820 [Pedobacter frigiditerrae]|uniref:Uncharacterized protein n=1 Tax=Pedobacter frigiditerrae TaxID=2530452 RepID=A0A4R0MTP7_9SPHI|nr:hypothetical protein [Pedobacter frigiditerrae]TCC90163.1 hypothetical protein EZ428_12820 [Pedobacter frigiditerrae]